MRLNKLSTTTTFFLAILMSSVCSAEEFQPPPVSNLPEVSLAVPRNAPSVAPHNDTATAMVQSQISHHTGEDNLNKSAEKFEPGKVLPTPEVVLPEEAKGVTLSSSDLNRIICADGEVKEALTSEEKGLMLKVSGREVFAKFKVSKRSDGKLGYSTTPTEIYIKCGNDTYTLIAFPDRLPSQTIKLSSGRKSRMEANTALYAGLPFEKRVMRVIKEVYTDQIPETYAIIRHKKVDTTFKGLSVVLLREVNVEGEGIKVKEYSVSLRSRQAPFKLSERSFIKKEFALNPVAISLDKHIIRPGDTARLFVVEQRAESQFGGDNGLQLPAFEGDVGVSPANYQNSPKSTVNGQTQQKQQLPLHSIRQQGALTARPGVGP